MQILAQIGLIAFVGAGSVHAQTPGDSSPKSFSQFLMTIDDETAAQDRAKATSGVKDVPENDVLKTDGTSGKKSGDDSTGNATQGNATQGNATQGEAADQMQDVAIDSATPLAVVEQTLSLADVVASLYGSFPEIQRARQQPMIAGGELLSSYGAYDTKFLAESLSEPTGFYENYRNGLALARQTWWGGYVGAGYRIGRGDFQPWYKERETNDAGEFKVAFSQPLLQGRAIDAQRVAVFQASLAQQAADPLIQQTILDVARSGAFAYWDWVATGRFLVAQRELLDLAEQRGEQYDVGFKAGKFAEIDVVLNQQLIAERQAKVLETDQKFRDTSYKLSLYLRDDNGRPLVPSENWLPKDFPLIQPQPLDNLQNDLAAALTRRPEPRMLQLEIQQVQLDRQLAQNEMLPRFDFVSEASQDMGPPATSSNDKGDFELVIGFSSEVPIQRRKARGKIQSTSGKIVQVSEKLRLAQDKIAVEIQSAANALRNTEQIVKQNETALKAARDTLNRYRFAFESGKIDLIYLNLLETKLNEIEIKLAEARRNWFAALASMQFALGLDPLDQAMQVSVTEFGEMPILLDEVLAAPVAQPQ